MLNFNLVSLSKKSWIQKFGCLIENNSINLDNDKYIFSEINFLNNIDLLDKFIFKKTCEYKANIFVICSDLYWNREVKLRKEFIDLVIKDLDKFKFEFKIWNSNKKYDKGLTPNQIFENYNKNDIILLKFHNDIETYKFIFLNNKINDKKFLKFIFYQKFWDFKENENILSYFILNEKYEQPIELFKHFCLSNLVYNKQLGKYIPSIKDIELELDLVNRKLKKEQQRESQVAKIEQEIDLKLDKIKEKNKIKSEKIKNINDELALIWQEKDTINNLENRLSDKINKYSSLFSKLIIKYYNKSLSYKNQISLLSHLKEEETRINDLLLIIRNNFDQNNNLNNQLKDQIIIKNKENTIFETLLNKKIKKEKELSFSEKLESNIKDFYLMSKSFNLKNKEKKNIEEFEENIFNFKYANDSNYNKLNDKFFRKFWRNRMNLSENNFKLIRELKTNIEGFKDELYKLFK